MNKKAVIFDLDGVIVHTDHYHYLAWKSVADHLKLHFDEKLNNQLRGVSRMESLDIILQSNSLIITDKEKEILAEQKNEIYKKFLLKMSPKDIDACVLETLLKLKESGLKIAIGSSSKNAKLILERTGMLNLFDAISDGNNITHSKPNPEVFQKAAQYMDFEPRDCIVVEDAVAGIDAGIAGGFETVAIGDATKYEKSSYKVNQFSELLEVLFN
ncbi:beta-phosphoglucomutase [[Clostridium] fimetarium]|uniref:Beta-phosphoglucomutase n=1 Tax=[Clostridium] fimetarium TaxID=99656 RepID=A0A1I0ND56_9FIRM|nr:beta-phosphoglucomutase [[Clostridium] fimetarium]SEV98980.1 beta-phosphoglucomutase/hypothetical glycosyl hydrolase [[Clostridium] fimetarium]